MRGEDGLGLHLVSCCQLEGAHSDPREAQASLKFLVPGEPSGGERARRPLVTLIGPDTFRHLRTTIWSVFSSAAAAAALLKRWPANELAGGRPEAVYVKLFPSAI